MPREFSRGNRVADLIHRELATLIQRELKDPRIGMVTLNEVTVSRDLSYADVYYTVLPEEKAEDSEQFLMGAAGFLRSKLARAINTRTTPKLRFHYDESLTRGSRLTQAIEQAVNSDQRDKSEPNG